MRGKHYQTCQCCGAGPLRVFTIPEDLRRFLGLSEKTACKWCIEEAEGRRSELRRAA